MEFNEILRQVRKSKNMTQQQVSDLLHISIRTYQNYEQGTREPNIDKLIKLADLFQISIDELVGRVEGDFYEI